MRHEAAVKDASTDERSASERANASLLVLLAIFTVPALISAAQGWVAYLLLDEWPKNWPYVALQFAIWWSWAPLAAIALRFADRYPVDGERWRRPAAVHTAAALAMTIGHAYVFTLVSLELQDLMEPGRARPSPIWPFMARSIAARAVTGLLTYGAILGVGTALRFHRRLRERELQASRLESQLATAQLQALKMQLHPHFLFNTLHAVTVLIREEPRAATRMVTQLADLLRLTLARVGRRETTLGHELEFVRLYLEIEGTRFHDRLSVTYDIATDVLDATVPDLILQPIVENAIKHGISASSQAGRISLHAWREHERLELRVRDDGPGPDGTSGAASGQGIGLSASRARLRGMYGEDQRLDLRTHPDGGCEVMLSLPFRIGARTDEHPVARPAITHAVELSHG